MLVGLAFLKILFFFFFQAEDGIRDADVTGVQTCALPISRRPGLEPSCAFGYDGGVTRKPQGTRPAGQTGARALLDGAEVAQALRVLARVAEDRGALAGLDAATREALQRLAGEIARPDDRQRKKLRKALRRGERDERKSRDGALRKGTGIRRLRDAPSFATPLPELPPAGSDASSWWPRLPAGPGAARAAVADDAPELAEARKCYVCKAEFRRLHAFYDQLCRACGDEN